jgi:hypothetical protein
MAMDRYEEEIRRVYGQMETGELIQRARSGNLTSSAQAVAAAELAQRGISLDRLTLDSEFEMAVSDNIEKKKGNSTNNTAGIIGAVLGIGLSRALGMAVFIPAALVFLSLFVLTKVEDTLKKRGKVFGGLGGAFSEIGTYKGLLALELGHGLWGVLGTLIYISGGLSSSEFEIDISNVIEIIIFWALVVFLFFRPGWVSVVLLVLYHGAAIYGINGALDDMSGLSISAKDALERAYVTHGLLHSVALFGLFWLSYALWIKGRSRRDAFSKSTN